MKTTILLFTIMGWTDMTAATETAWPEHPRPDYKREPWVNLNGPWDFGFDARDVGEKEQWFVPGKHVLDRKIIVPFPWESRLSGIADAEYKGVAWYAREIELPAGNAWKDRDAWLVIGACDWSAKVWVNGQLAAEHVGGYVPFDVNLSRFGKSGEKVAVVIRAVDTTDPQQPTGKQINWYTRTSGIWQTVYLEGRGRSFIRSIRAETRIATGEVKYTVRLDGQPAQGILTVFSPDGSFDAARIPLDGRNQMVEATITVREPKLWSPDSPTLYPVTLTLGDPDGLPERSDVVESYFGLREVSVGKAPGRDYQYIQLNGKPIYLRGALHQSFHPDGIYQYPDDGVMQSDYDLCKRIDLNCLRIHIKIPVPRELYWADKVGVLIMQDMPGYWKHTPQAQRWWREMFEAAVERDFNHPSVFSWCLFNETWGIGDGGYSDDRQQWVAQMFEWAKRMDPTRLIEDNSPCLYDHVATDINSWHFYINDYQQARKHIQEVVRQTHPGSTFNFAGGRQQTDAPLINSEYGGIGSSQGDQDVSWCFKYLTNELRLHDKICGYVYTELSDIEWEHNGFVNYDRTPKDFGYGLWHPGFSLKDLNNPDFVAIDAPPVVELKPGESRDIPIKISHWSERPGGSLSVRWRVDWFDRFASRTEGRWQGQSATWEPYRVVDQPAIRVTADGTGLLGALLVELRDGQGSISRNYVNLRVQRGPAPRVEGVSESRLALRWSPADLAAWTFTGGVPAPEGIGTHKVCGHGCGVAEYRLSIPEQVPLMELSELTVVAELSSKAKAEKLDWPARRNSLDYPQSDVKRWPTDVNLLLNGEKVLPSVETLEDDPADAWGVLSHARRYHPGSYGYLTRATLQGEGLRKLVARIGADRVLRVRFEVPADAVNKGGLSVFGEELGAYPLEPTCLLVFNKPHGFKAGFISTEPVSVERMDASWVTVLPAADRGGAEWQYTTTKPGGRWTAPDYDAKTWKRGKGGFGTRETPGAVVNTVWDTPDIWLRTEITLGDPAKIRGALWRLQHDDDVDIHLNGQRVLLRRGHETDYISLLCDDQTLELFRSGRNTIAVHCRQADGGQKVDVGLSMLSIDVPVATRSSK